MSFNAISNYVYTSHQQVKNQAHNLIKQARESSFSRKVCQISSGIRRDTQEVLESKDSGNAVILASKISMASSLLLPSGSIFATHAKWSLAAGYGTCLSQGRKMNSYYQSFIKYPDKLEQYWNQKASETSFTGRILMGVPRHLSTFSTRVTALAVETLVDVSSACAKSAKEVASQKISERIKDSSKKDLAFQAAQVVGIAIVALPTAYYFSQTISSGLKTVGSAALAFESLKFLREKSIEALQVDYSGYGHAIEEKVELFKTGMQEKQAKVNEWKNSGSPRTQMAKRVAVTAGVSIACAAVVSAAGLTVFHSMKFTLMTAKAAYPMLKMAPHAMASFKFLEVAFPKSENSTESAPQVEDK